MGLIWQRFNQYKNLSWLWVALCWWGQFLSPRTHFLPYLVLRWAWWASVSFFFLLFQRYVGDTNLIIPLFFIWGNSVLLLQVTFPRSLILQHRIVMGSLESIKLPSSQYSRWWQTEVLVSILLLRPASEELSTTVHKLLMSFFTWSLFFLKFFNDL